MITYNRFFAVSSVFTFAMLIASWGYASEDTVSASSETVCEFVESECHDVTLEIGREGDTVRVCERVQLVCSEVK
jgi:hypothetical protein